MVIAGPTAIGKTRLAITLAKALNTEIISCDSRQFFTEMSIGTAKPSAEERAAAPHHFVDCKSVVEEYSAGQFERDVLARLDELFVEHRVVIMVGGSGLYIDAITKGFDYVPADLEIRKSLMQRLEDEGLESLQQELKTLDPEHYARMDIQNTQRLVRALEVCLASGTTFSSFRKETDAQRPFNFIKIALTAERELIYERIEQRVDEMIEAGLIDEVKSLRPHRELNALKTVGYREVFAHLDGESTLEEAIEEIKMNTRRFAKRQLTWFRRDDGYRWFDTTNSDEILPYIQAQITPR